MPNNQTLTPSAEFWSWRNEAACIGYEELFYHREDEGKGTRRAKEAEAKAICSACPVLDVCRDFALETHELYGVWGGLTEAERHRIAGRQRTG